MIEENLEVPMTPLEPSDTSLMPLEPPLCQCEVCEDCINREIGELRLSPCLCTYTTVQEEILDEEGNNITVDKNILDIKCERCLAIDTLRKKLEDYKLFKKAYVPFELWQNLTVVDGVIMTPIKESLDKILQKRLVELSVYKHSKIDVFEFNGHKQRWTEKDKGYARDVYDMLKDQSDITSVEWTHTDGVEVGETVTANLDYITQMRMYSALITQAGFYAERIITEKLVSLTDRDELNTYDFKSYFGRLYNEYLETYTNADA